MTGALRVIRLPTEHALPPGHITRAERAITEGGLCLIILCTYGMGPHDGGSEGYRRPPGKAGLRGPDINGRSA
jgi:hypothetical protein